MAINLERAALKGRLVDAKKELQVVIIKADNLVADIRAILDPYAESITEIDTERALVLMEELNALRRDAQKLTRKVKEFEVALNG